MSTTEHSGPTILLVDDDPAIRKVVAAGLELEGFNVVPASGGRAALEAVPRVSPAVIEDRVGGLEAGADDYVVKPFALQEVIARVHALLRRQPAASTAELVVGDLTLDPVGHIAKRGERDLELTRREFELLRVFMQNPGEVLDRPRLHEDVWGYTFDPQTNVCDVFVGYLRKKLEADGEPRVVHTVRGVGFVLRP